MGRCQHIYDNLFDYNPMLSIGIAALLGNALYFLSFHLLVIGIFLFFLLFLKKRRLLFLLISCFFFLFTWHCYPTNYNLTYPVKGRGIFEIDSIQTTQGFKNDSLLQYKGKMIRFWPESSDIALKNLGCAITHKKTGRPLGNYSYFVEGVLNKRGNYYFLKTKAAWAPHQKKFSLTELRYQAKKAVKMIAGKYFSKNNGHLVAALITGEPIKYISFIFSKAGLSHVLAISGFHFALLVGFFSFFLKRIFKSNFYVILLLIIANLYFFFIGPSPSVTRSWIMIQLALVSKMLSKNYFSLNALGFSLIMLLLIDPKYAQNIGFQLSFLAVVAIFLINPHMKTCLFFMCKARSSEELEKLTLLNKAGYYLAKYFQEAFCLTISINLLIIPLLLYHFYKFPLASLIYNLYVPLLISFIMLGVLILLMLHFVFPFLALFLSKLLNPLIECLMNMITYIPGALDIYIRNQNVSAEFVIIYIFIVINLFLIKSNHQKKNIINVNKI